MTKYVNKMKIAMLLFIIVFGFNNLFAHPYDFVVTAEMNEDCCIEVTVAVPTYGTLTHEFTAFIGDEIIEDAAAEVDKAVIDGWKYGENAISKVFCKDDYTPNLDIVLYVQIWCNGQESNGEQAHWVEIDDTDDDIFEELHFHFRYDCVDCDCVWLGKPNETGDPAYTGPAFITVEAIEDCEDCIDQDDCEACEAVGGCFYKINFGNFLAHTEGFDWCYDWIYFEVEGDLEPDGSQHRDSRELTDFIDNYIAEGHLYEKTFCSLLRDGTITIGLSKTEYGEAGENCEWIIDAPCYKDMNYDPLPPPDPCIPDFPTIAWSNETRRSFDILIDGQMQRVTYDFVHRDANGNQDIQVTQLVYNGTGLSKSEVFALIIQNIIEEQYNVTKFEPNPDYVPNGDTVCNSTWRVVGGSCWATIPVVVEQGPSGDDAIIIPNLDDPPVNTLIPYIISYHIYNFYPVLPIESVSMIYSRKCDDVECCIQQIEVCLIKDEFGNKTWEKTVLDPPDEQPLCIEEFYEYSETRLIQCDPGCHWISSLENYWTNEKITIHSQELDDVIVNLTNSQFEVILNLVNEGKIELNIYDNNGNLLKSADEILGNSKNRIAVNISELRTGAYYYNVIVNGKIMRASQFIIVR